MSATKKLWWLLGLVLSLCVSFHAFAQYQQQGFTTYAETGGTISFSCTTQCFILLWPLGSNQLLALKGTMQWGGQIGYGFLVGQQIYPGEMLLANGSVNSSFVFPRHQLFSKLDKQQTQIALVVNGNVQTTDLTIDFWKLFFSEKVAMMWTDFRTNEPLRPYSINLRYGIKLLWTPLFIMMYWLFALGVVAIFFTNRSGEKKRSAIFLFACVLLVLFSLRNIWNRTDWTITWFTTYVAPETDQKTFFDLGDYPVFIQKMRTALSLDEKFWATTCTMFFDAAQEWPFKVHADTVYMKPCEPAADKTTAEYIVYYKKPIGPEGQGKEVLLDWNGSFLIRNK